jgi:8-oxo-dGTP pyrophosphatase MutT (NUDIX family)
MDIWKPSTTVAAVIEHDGLLLMIEEHTALGLRLNQPAGHLDPGETLQQAVVRETLEETAWTVEAIALQGVHMARFVNAAAGVDVTYLRHTFLCRPISHDPTRALDEGIVRAFWMSPAEILACPQHHRSPLVERAVLDFLANRRADLDIVWTHDSALDLTPAGPAVSGP